MTDAALPTASSGSLRQTVEARLKKRHAAEMRFRLYGRLAIVVALVFLTVLIGRIVTQGYTTFVDYQISVPVKLDASRIDAADPSGANYDLMVAESVLAKLGETDDEFGEKSGKIMEVMSNDLGFQLLKMVREDPSLIGKTVTVTGPLKSDGALYFKGEIKRSVPEDSRKLDDQQLDWLDKLKASGAVTSGFNLGFLTRSDSTEPEQAGVLGAIVGSAMMLLVTAFLAVPIGVLAATYLEEFAPKNRWTDLIEVNINNLAAVPSIIFGLLGLAVFLGFFGLPRSAPLVGGLVMALMTLPVIIIASRVALKAVPPSIREAALGVGASPLQTVTHHVLPLALPGILTGTIIGMARALGETAPLLMIGMVAFIVDIPGGLTDSATAMPVQIYMWADSPERAFTERTSAAILILLAFLILMNGLAVFLRKKFERRW